MAKMGLKYLAWAKMAAEPVSAPPTYEPGVTLGKMVSMNMDITTAEGELYADDMLAEYVSEFSKGALTIEVDNISLEMQAKQYGAKYENGELQMFTDDLAPYGAYGGYQSLLVNNQRKYRAWLFCKCKAKVPNMSGSTRGSSISFGTQPINATIMPPAFGPWYRAKEFDDEASAKAYVDTYLGAAEWHRIDVQLNGAGAGEGATPSGGSVANGGTFTLTLAGTPVKLYDNGVDCTADITGGVYTLSNVSAAHQIAVIF